MDLTPSQRFVLQEMGIPVWELREQNPSEALRSQVAVADSQPTQQIDEVLLGHADCLIVVDDSNLEQANQRLLNSMLHVVGIKQSVTKVLTTEQFQSFKQQAADRPRLLLLLGDAVAEQFVTDYQGLNHHLGKTCQVSNSKLPAFVCESLPILLQEPAKKYRTWLSLLAVKEHYQRLS